MEHEKGYTYIQEAIHLITNTGNKPRYAWALGALYDVKLYEDDFNTAIVLEEEAMTIYDSCGCRFWAANCASNIGICYLRQGAYQEATKYFRDTLEVFREFGHKYQIANTLNRLGEAYRGLDEHDKAAACYREALAIDQGIAGNAGILIQYYLNLGSTVLYCGDYKQAVSLPAQHPEDDGVEQISVPAIAEAVGRSHLVHKGIQGLAVPLQLDQKTDGLQSRIAKPTR